MMIRFPLRGTAIAWVARRVLVVLTDEIARRDSTAADNRARDAGLDPAMRLEQWDKSSKVTFDKRMLAELVSLRFLEAHRHVVVLGTRRRRQDVRVAGA